MEACDATTLVFNFEDTNTESHLTYNQLRVFRISVFYILVFYWNLILLHFSLPNFLVPFACSYSHMDEESHSLSCLLELMPLTQAPSNVLQTGLYMTG